jgi:hypothetical protein
MSSDVDHVSVGLRRRAVAASFRSPGLSVLIGRCMWGINVHWYRPSNATIRRQRGGEWASLSRQVNQAALDTLSAAHPLRSDVRGRWVGNMRNGPQNNVRTVGHLRWDNKCRMAPLAWRNLSLLPPDRCQEAGEWFRTAAPFFTGGGAGVGGAERPSPRRSAPPPPAEVLLMSGGAMPCIIRWFQRRVLVWP